MKEEELRRLAARLQNIELALVLHLGHVEERDKIGYRLYEANTALGGFAIDQFIGDSHDTRNTSKA